jgi:valyl-tRNA synthetase
MKPIIEKLEKQQEKVQKEFDKLNGMFIGIYQQR